MSGLDTACRVMNMQHIMQKRMINMMIYFYDMPGSFMEPRSYTKAREKPLHPVVARHTGFEHGSSHPAASSTAPITSTKTSGTRDGLTESPASRHSRYRHNEKQLIAPPVSFHRFFRKNEITESTEDGIVDSERSPVKTGIAVRHLHGAIEKDRPGGGDRTEFPEHVIP
jgi:hypothetical protein